MDLSKSLLALGCPILVEILDFYMVGYSRYLRCLSGRYWEEGPLGRHWEIPIQGPDTGWGSVGKYQDNSIPTQLEDTGRGTDSIKNTQANQG